MDDWIFVTENKWKLRRAIKIVNQALESLNLEKQPDAMVSGGWKDKKKRVTAVTRY